MKSNYPELKQIIRGLVAVASFCTFSSAFAGPPEKDRQAILSMAGEYDVTFSFEETVSLQPGYELTEPYEEDAKEIVFIVKDTPEQISLQHILIVAGGKKIVKHWKQTWTWEDRQIVEFLGNQKWKVNKVDVTEVAGTWSQLVTQVDDSPRYESYGKWNHDGGYSRWESTVTPRPLPRREYKKRKDYQIMLATNRHAITPLGWVHRQDNLKLVVGDDGKKERYISRETGLNSYHTSKGEDFSSARSYWEKTESYWAIVSSIWDEIMNTEGKEITIVEEGKDDTLMDEIFAWADTVEGGGKLPEKADVAETIRSYLK